MFALYCQLAPHLKQVIASDAELYLDYPMARSQNSESPLIFILDPQSPLGKKYNHVYPGTNTSIPLVTFYRSDFLVAFERLITMLPYGVVFDPSVGSKADWDYNLDVQVVSEWLADPRHHIKTLIINAGPHYNSVQFGGGVDLGAMQEVYRSAIEYITQTLETKLRQDQVVFFRASTSGHSNGKGICLAKNPLKELVRIKYFDWNWHGQETFNALWKVFLSEAHLQGRLKRIRYLDISRPTMLRPDAVHTHFMVWLMFSIRILRVSIQIVCIFV